MKTLRGCCGSVRQGRERCDRATGKIAHLAPYQHNAKNPHSLSHNLVWLIYQIDRLTESPNLRQFDRILEEEWRRSQRSQTPLTLIIIGIDYFKNFNDSYGHTSVIPKNETSATI